jgi:hypothetical protein
LSDINNFMASVSPAPAGIAPVVCNFTQQREIVLENRSIDEAQGFQFVDGEWIPIFDITPEMEHQFYAAGAIGPEGLTIARSTPRPRLENSETRK